YLIGLQKPGCFGAAASPFAMVIPAQFLRPHLMILLYDCLAIKDSRKCIS
ncbi:uncharacterized protein METZ01_LOCUS200274, partial [marine metagenome]